MSNSMMSASRPESAIGSPDTFHSFPDDAAIVRSVVTNNSLPRLATTPVTPTRRRQVLDRSASSPHVHLTETRGSTRTSPFPSVAHDREWSLFGQLMEDEGQLRPANSTKIRRRNAQHRADATSPQPSVAEHDPFLVSSVPSNRLPSLSADPDPIRPDPPDFDDYSSDDSDVSSDATPTPREFLTPPSRYPSWLQPPTLSRLQKNVLKCGLAYFLSSLFTFVPYLSSFLADVPSNGKWERGPSPSGHMVATVSVYFNPAKTIGAMAEADIYVVFGVAFSTFVSIGSMSTFWFFQVRPGWEWLADALVLCWIAASIIVVAWLKVWMSRPSFNTACSMISIIIFTDVVMEGGVQTLAQLCFTVVVGSVVSNLTCFALWTQSATTNLQDDMITALDSFATLLQMLTRTFLLDPDFHPKQSKLLRAVDAHQKSFTSLKRHLTEAHSEWLCSPRPLVATSAAYDDAVDCLNRLAQHLGGLRSGTRLQADLTRAHRDGKLVLQRGVGNTKLFVPAGSKVKDWTPGTWNSRTPTKGKIAVDEDDEAMLSAAASMFGDLVDDLGPPMIALANTCTTTLKRMQGAFERHRNGDPMDLHEFFQLSEDIERALYAFDRTSNHAVMRLYRRSDTTDRFSITSEDAVPTILANGDNETVFLVYFFIFTIQEFARELVLLVDAMGRIYALERRAAKRSNVWQWIKNRFTCLRSRTRHAASPLRSKVVEPATLRRRLSTLVPIEAQVHKIPKFPKVKPHAPNTMQTPSRASLTFAGRMKQSFWALGARLKEPDMKYAFKAGVATAMLAAPAFFDATRPWFVEYRGEWALVSFFIVISPFIGQTNFLSVVRVLGTILGAVTAIGAYLALHNQPILLAFFGFLFSLPCFYYIVSNPQHASSGRFVLLTYNLTCLYCYNLRYQEPSVVEIAFYRAVAVIIGVLWAFIVSQFWWPAEARRELGKALGEFCLNIGWLYSRMVMHYSAPPEALLSVEPPPTSDTTPLLHQHTHISHTTLTPRASDQLTASIHDFLAMELHLQRKLITLQDLLAQTQHEPRLKGPFPVKLYRSILTSLQTILDKMHSMRCVTTREEWCSFPFPLHTVRRDFIVPVSKERREMVGNVILYFSTLSSAFRLKAPLPPYLPPAEKSRQELVNAIRNLDVVKTRNVQGSRQLLYFAYALMMKGVVQELDFLARTLQEAFGVLGGSTEDFDNLFRVDGVVAEAVA
ncbi:Fusaric acid resistance protein-like-domain-containing protein [Gautieria morchelliformis]|nr:Fusaric acid resistance protein-like-domain-containing protein [Gautieria morchelliformis]